MYLIARADTMDVLAALPGGRASHRAAAGPLQLSSEHRGHAGATTWAGNHARECHKNLRLRTAPLFLIHAVQSSGNPQSHPHSAQLLKSCRRLYVGSGPSTSAACGDGLINGERLHTSPKTFHAVEGEELTSRG